MAAKAVVGATRDRAGVDRRSDRVEGFRARRIDDEIVADPVQSPDQLDRVDPETGRIAADDGRVDRDARAEVAGRRASLRPD